MPKPSSWTDDQLRAAVASSTTYVEVLRKLELRDGSSRYVQETIRKLGLDTSHFTPSPRKRLCTDETLQVLVATSKTCTEILQCLDVELHSNNFCRLRRRIRDLALDTSHFLRERSTVPGRRTRWTDDELRAAVASSKGFAEAIRKIGLIPAGGNYAQVQKRIRDLGLDTSHFLGRGWNVEGKHIKPIARPLEELLVANRSTTSHHLKQRLIRAGLKEAACELCGWAQARTLDNVIPIEIDHINGDKDDNRLENLRILCPNCHALQATHRGLNQKRRTKSK